MKDCISHLNFIVQNMAIYLCLNERDKQNWNTYELVKRLGEEEKILEKQREVMVMRMRLLSHNLKFFADPAGEIPEATQFWIKGNRALEGFGESINTKKALRYYTKAAELGSVEAHRSIGLLYEEGLGVKEDKKMAIKEYKKGMEKDDPAAIYELGRIHEEEARSSLKKNQNYEKAKQYYIRAAKKNYGKAFTKLGILSEEDYNESVGFSKDCMENYKRGAERDDSLAYNMMGEYYLNKEKTQEKAFYYFNEARKRKSPIGAKNLGICYYEGWGTMKNKDKAKECFKEAVSGGCESAILNLAEVTASEGDYEDAAMWYRQYLVDDKRSPNAAEAYIRLAEYYELGKGVEKNCEIAFQYYKAAGLLNDARGYKRCGDLMYTNERLDNPDVAQALECYKKAANLNKPESTEALMVLAQIHERGCNEVEQSVDEAIRLYHMAYKLGNPYAGVNECRVLQEESKKDQIRKNVLLKQCDEIMEEILRKYNNDEKVKDYIMKNHVIINNTH